MQKKRFSKSQMREIAKICRGEKYESAYNKLKIKQNGSERHANALAAGIYYVVNHYGYYRNFREAVNDITFEESLTDESSEIPDAYSREYRFVIEAGHKLFSGYFTDRCNCFCYSLLSDGDNPGYWNFIHMPKPSGLALDDPSERAVWRIADAEYDVNKPSFSKYKRHLAVEAIGDKLRCRDRGYHTFFNFGSKYECNCGLEIPEEKFDRWVKQFDLDPSELLFDMERYNESAQNWD